MDTLTSEKFHEQKRRIFEALKQSIGRLWIGRDGTTYLIVNAKAKRLKVSLKLLDVETQETHEFPIYYVTYELPVINTENVLNTFAALHPAEEEEYEGR